MEKQHAIPEIIMINRNNSKQSTEGKKNNSIFCNGKEISQLFQYCN